MDLLSVAPHSTAQVVAPDSLNALTMPVFSASMLAEIAPTTPDRRFTQSQLISAYEQIKLARKLEAEEAAAVAQYLEQCLGTMVSAIPADGGGNFSAELSPHPREYRLIIRLFTAAPWSDGSVEILSRIPGLVITASEGEDLFRKDVPTFTYTPSQAEALANIRRDKYSGTFEKSRWSPPCGWI